jgi:hypothetical protein
LKILSLIFLKLVRQSIIVHNFYFQDIYNKEIKKKGTNKEQPFWIPILAGATARVWAATLVSPLELTRTKMQSQKLSYAGRIN